MRLSCNGCRVLRKGCSENCSIRPCLEWIKSPDSQANATVFLAKFYGRAGLMNLINAGPHHLRPAIFRSLLYEACGRIVNPIYGSVGLMWSGSWQLCQTAVEAVLKGAPITQISTDAAEAKNGPPLKAFDIRHVTKDGTLSGSGDLHRVRTRCRFKRSASKGRRSRVWVGSPDESGNGSPSHESALSHQSATAEPVPERTSRRSEESLGSAETPEPEAHADRNSESEERLDDAGDVIELDLTLGFEPIKQPKMGKLGEAVESAELCKMELGLDL
ncbi:LOB domain-containing protein 41-like [Salvia miltiorrhiza]|uniref:LOB domain-containing protein 41-like n=1 Tax=Salvia miltiorrhiza TaxID=226208 RepID=UPI0025AB83CF|nr:LOB domain-containing protein 41-like [Salvia miltiorrhiza]XP_057809587.1 LOB domain-containing protein 41-like [Salvia miltiorrhiza]